MRHVRTVLLSVIFLVLLTGCAKQDGKQITSREDLTGVKIGAQNGTTGELSATEEYGDKYVERFNSGMEAVMSLKQGKIDAVIIDDCPARIFAEHNEDVELLEDAYSSEDYAICLKKGNDELTTQINEAIAQLKENGTFAQIENYYIGKVEGSQPYQKKENKGENGTLIMATNAEFEPYEYRENNEIVGLDVDMMQAICDILGKKLIIEDMKFDAIITAVSTGKADVGCAGMTVTEDRLKSVNFTDPYYTGRQAILVKKQASTVVTSLKDRFYQNFIKDNRYRYLTNGLVVTLQITFFAILIGMTFGFLIAFIRTTYEKNNKFKVLNYFCKLYITIIRGTPLMTQLMIIYFVVFQSVSISKTLVAIIAFGLNSAAYIAEIARSGIMAVDAGQFEAGRSLGFTYGQTMKLIILPQAVKNILPALGNEFISLLKETSIVGYITLEDLTKGGDIIRSRSFDAFFPLMAVALIYLILVVILTKIVNRLERRLRNSDH